jgi:hypothetical protein
VRLPIPAGSTSHAHIHYERHKSGSGGKGRNFIIPFVAVFLFSPFHSSNAELK